MAFSILHRIVVSETQLAPHMPGYANAFSILHRIVVSETGWDTSTSVRRWCSFSILHRIVVSETDARAWLRGYPFHFQYPPPDRSQ